MRYGQIRKYDIANGPGIRTSMFVTGCTHHCKGCFNELYMDFGYGAIWTETQTRLLIDSISEEMISGISVLGGEPMQNAEDLIEVLTAVREHIEKYNAECGSKRKTVWLYSGYTLEEILQDETRTVLLSLCDVLVDGRFVEEKKNIRLRFRGSENQRILDVPKSLEIRKAVWLEGFAPPDS